MLNLYNISIDFLIYNIFLLFSMSFLQILDYFSFLPTVKPLPTVIPDDTDDLVNRKQKIHRLISTC